MVNVGITARLASRAQREQWRRAEERPIVARCLTLSKEALAEEMRVSRAKRGPDVPTPWPDERWQKCQQLVLDLYFEVAQLDLLASEPVRNAALELHAAHDEETARLMQPKQDDEESMRAAQLKIVRLHFVLVERSRTDLGVGLPERLASMLLAKTNGPQTPPRRAGLGMRGPHAAADIEPADRL